MARGGVRDVPGKRRRVARIGYLGSRATKQSQEDEVDANTSSWVTEAVAHARALLGDRTPPQGVPEAAALLTSILLCLPELWEELAQDTLLAFGNVIAGGDASGCARSRAGGPAFVAGKQDLSARTRRLLLSSVASVVCKVNDGFHGSGSSSSAKSVSLLCLLGEAQADEGLFMAAFRTLQRAQAMARQSNHSSDRAEAALQGLRAAALQRWHFQMINDVPRAEAYDRAIQAAVSTLSQRPEVLEAGGVRALDIGAGTGLLSLMCARLEGVKEIHACEMNDALCAVAKEVIASQPPSWAPVTVHPMVSTKLTLPKFDLIFCEVFDAGLLGEHALPTILHARRELLKPNGILIPARAKIFGQIVEAPELLERFAVLESPAGVPLRGARLRNSERYSCETMSTIAHVALTEPVELVTFDLQEIEDLYSNLGNWIDPPLELRVQKTGVAHALIYWWELQLDGAGNSRIHTSQRGGCESWEQAVKPLTLPLEDVPLREHEIVRLRLALRRQADGLEVILEDKHGRTSLNHEIGADRWVSEDVATWPKLELEEEELLRLNDSNHWQVVDTALQRAMGSLPDGMAVQLLHISESLPLGLLLPSMRRVQSAVAGVSSDDEKEVMESLLAHSDLAMEVHLLLASPEQVIQAALPAPYPPVKDGPGKDEMLPAAILLCEDIVGGSGGLRSEAFEDLALLWKNCAGKLNGRELRIVPEAIEIRFALMESPELERRTRVVERPCGLDVSGVNALSVPEFLSLEESLLKPKWLSQEVEALSLPLDSSLPTALAALSATGPDGQPLLRVRLVANSQGHVHGVVMRCHWAQGGQAIRKKQDERLAGIIWPVDGGKRPPELTVGDAVVVTVRYSPARGSGL